MTAEPSAAERFAAERFAAMPGDLRWLILDELRAHSYNYRDKGDRPTDPGWHACTCGWAGYWCSYQPHVADRILAAVLAERADRRTT